MLELLRCQEENTCLVYENIMKRGGRRCASSSPRQAGDITQAPASLEPLADKAHDSDALRATIAATAVVPSNRTRRIIIPNDVIAYRHRNRIEYCLNRLKHFR
jgi:hypothetical protein